MINHPIIQRVEILFRQKRYQDAINTLKDYLAQYPDDFYASYYLANAYLFTYKGKEARIIAQQLLVDNPESDQILYLLAQIDILEERNEEAESKARELIQRNAEDPDHYILLGRIKYRQRYLDDALSYIEQALELDAQNIEAHNLRILITQQIGASRAAQDSIDEILAIDPENPTTIANQGIQHLHQGKVNDALDEFKEALSIQPTNEIARYGMKEALKSKNIIYRLFSLYERNMAKLSGNKIWIFIIGSYIALQLINRAAENTEGISKLIFTVLTVTIVSLFLLTWVVNPLMNLVLFTNRYGKILLNDDEKKMAKMTGLSLSLAILFGILAAVFPATPIINLAILFAGLMIPSGTFLIPHRDNNRKKLRVFGLSIFIAGLIGFLLLYLNIPLIFYLALFGLLGYQFYFNKVIIDDYARRF